MDVVIKLAGFWSENLIAIALCVDASQSYVTFASGLTPVCAVSKLLVSFPSKQTYEQNQAN